MVDRDARRQLGEMLQNLLAEKVTWQDFSAFQVSKSKDIAPRKIHEDLQDWLMQSLPLRPGPWKWNEHVKLFTQTINRAIMFLNSVEEMPRPKWSWLGILYVFSFPFTFVCMIVGELVGRFYSEELESWIIGTGIVSFGVLMSIIFPLYIYSMFLAGIHIFRVRILRQDLTAKTKQWDEDGFWPFASREQLECVTAKVKNT